MSVTRLRSHALIELYVEFIRSEASIETYVSIFRRMHDPRFVDGAEEWSGRFRDIVACHHRHCGVSCCVSFCVESVMMNIISPSSHNEDKNDGDGNNINNNNNIKIYRISVI